MATGAELKALLEQPPPRAPSGSDLKALVAPDTSRVASHIPEPAQQAIARTQQALGPEREETGRDISRNMSLILGGMRLGMQRPLGEGLKLLGRGFRRSPEALRAVEQAGGAQKKGNVLVNIAKELGIAGTAAAGADIIPDLVPGMAEHTTERQEALAGLIFALTRMRQGPLNVMISNPGFKRLVTRAARGKLEPAIGAAGGAALASATAPTDEPSEEAGGSFLGDLVGLAMTEGGDFAEAVGELLGVLGADEDVQPAPRAR